MIKLCVPTPSISSNIIQLSIPVFLLFAHHTICSRYQVLQVHVGQGQVLFTQHLLELAAWNQQEMLSAPFQFSFLDCRTHYDQFRWYPFQLWRPNVLSTHQGHHRRAQQKLSCRSCHRISHNWQHWMRCRSRCEKFVKGLLGKG